MIKKQCKPRLRTGKTFYEDLYGTWVLFILDRLHSSKPAITDFSPILLTFYVKGSNLIKHLPQLKRECPWPTDCSTFLMRQLLNMDRAEKKQPFIIQCTFSHQRVCWTSLFLEGINIRSSIRDNAQIKSSTTSSLLPDLIFMGTRSACLPPQYAIVTAYCAQRGGLHRNFYDAITLNTWAKESVLWHFCSSSDTYVFI